MAHKIDVIDIFAGPGGLGEGFSTCVDHRGRNPFRILASAEKDPSAHSTLSLRALFRACTGDGTRALQMYHRLTEQYARVPNASVDSVVDGSSLERLWRRVRNEAIRVELGTSRGDGQLNSRIRATRRQSSEALVLIGGPPCQAYSVVGRVRNRGKRDYRPEDDDRHFLYREYLRILADFQPDIFVMENVKGLLSSRVGGQRIVEKILADLRCPSGQSRRHARAPIQEYELLPLGSRNPTRTLDGIEWTPSDFIVRAEDYGIPQNRHRLIILGVHRRIGRKISAFARLQPCAAASVSTGDALANLPKVRSGITDGVDSYATWLHAFERQRKNLIRLLRRTLPDVAEFLSDVRVDAKLSRSCSRFDHATGGRLVALHGRGSNSHALFNHETRTHMDADLARYMFCAGYAQVHGRSPPSIEFPEELAPQHRSWAAGHFADRFRVQTPDKPSSTITSHLAKDGHHFIHWDPSQCRSLTVREAARLQTFPDDYLFLGNRTQQYTQVGNAVPPLLARQIAGVVAAILR